MNSQQVIQAIEKVMESPAFGDRGDRGLFAAEDAFLLVRRTLQQTNPCPACNGSGVDASKPFDARKIFDDGDWCDTCNGEGYPIEDGDTAVYEWVLDDYDRRVADAYGPAPAIEDLVVEG